MDPTELARSEVRKAVRPIHGGLGWKYPGVEDFSSNLNPYGPPAEMAGYIAEASDRLMWYPDDHSTEFRQAICERFHLRDVNVIAGAGTAELIRLFPETFLGPGEKVLMPRPTFAEYSFGCQLMGAEVVDMPLLEENDLRIDIAETISKLDGVKTAYLCNPNNPTGRTVPKKEVLEIARECARKRVLLFLDETLLELVPDADSISCMKEVESFDNVFLIRSLTKCFAMPGLRIGFGVGDARLIKAMDHARLSWNLGTIEQHVGARLLLDSYGHIKKAAEMMDREKVRMAREISATGLVKASEPDAFFFFARCADGTGAEMQDRLLRHKVLVRDCSSFGKPFDHYIRFSVKTPERNALLIDAFKAEAD